MNIEIMCYLIFGIVVSGVASWCDDDDDNFSIYIRIIGLPLVIMIGASILIKYILTYFEKRAEK